MNSRIFVCITRILLIILAAAVVTAEALIFLSPAVNDLFEEFYSAGEGSLMFHTFMVGAGAIALWILIELYIVVDTVNSDPFVCRNVSAFIRMGCGAEAAALLFLAKCAVYFTPMTAVCAVVMLLSGLFALILAGVFRKAVNYKQENDLTV